jgi:hypothetical protein
VLKVLALLGAFVPFIAGNEVIAIGRVAVSESGGLFIAERVNVFRSAPNIKYSGPGSNASPLICEGIAIGFKESGGKFLPWTDCSQRRPQLHHKGVIIDGIWDDSAMHSTAGIPRGGLPGIFYNNTNPQVIAAVLKKSNFVRQEIRTQLLFRAVASDLDGLSRVFGSNHGSGSSRAGLFQRAPNQNNADPSYKGADSCDPYSPVSRLCHAPLGFKIALGAPLIAFGCWFGWWSVRRGRDGWEIPTGGLLTLGGMIAAIGFMVLIV